MLNLDTIVALQKKIICTNSSNTIAKHQASQVWNHIELHYMLKIVDHLE
jgi:hypothetical protein